MDIATRLELLEVRTALQDAQHAYAQAFDNHDRQLFRAAFHDDAELVLGELWGTHRGIDAILASAEESWAGANAMHHWMANSRFDIDLASGTATGSVTLDCLSTFVELGAGQVAARYEDEFTAVDGVWKISKRTMHLQFVTPLPNWAVAQGTEAVAVATTG